MDAIMKDLHALTRYTWYYKPDEDDVQVAELSLQYALQWKAVSYDAIARLAVVMQYLYCTMAALEPVDVYLNPYSLPEEPDYHPLGETRSSLMYLIESCGIHAAKFSGLSRSLPLVAFARRRCYRQAADVWWKSRLKLEAFHKALGWLWFTLKRFTQAASLARREGLAARERTVLRMDAERMQVTIGDFVDKWLAELRDAQSEAKKHEYSSDTRLYYEKHVQDLLDELARELVTYIEHPPGYESNEKAGITAKDGKLVVALDGDDYNTASEATRSARLSFVMGKILKEKGTLAQGGDLSLYNAVSNLLKPSRLSPPPDRLSLNPEYVDFNTKSLPDAQEDGQTHIFYDPANVSDNLELKKVFRSRVNLEDVDQYRNANHRFGTTLTNRFMHPDYRTLDKRLANRVPLMNKNTFEKGKSNVKAWVANRTALPLNKNAFEKGKGNMKAWVASQNKRVNKQADVALNNQGLTATAEDKRLIAESIPLGEESTAKAIANVALTTNGGPPPVKAVSGALKDILQPGQVTPESVATVFKQNNLVASKNGHESVANVATTGNPSAVLAAVAQVATFPAGGEAPTEAVVSAANAINKSAKANHQTPNFANFDRSQLGTGTKTGPNLKTPNQLNAKGGSNASKMAATQVALIGNGFRANGPEGLANIAKKAGAPNKDLRETIQNNTTGARNNVQVANAAEAVKVLTGSKLSESMAANGLNKINTSKNPFVSKNNNKNKGISGSNLSNSMAANGFNKTNTTKNPFVTKNNTANKPIVSSTGMGWK
ncbi:hypothetical protein KFL_007280050 [Klebsormidium nitens]|uniref:Uncharacterized protein n=1 Tax=Klebsormidium nitens TaxID=105231 RepID=A0A1Y1IQS4_KLENI|nr:hypothetical protein KFL_007280050 [Klebsormidium nitens]|eukprot:GAQ91106.1 hypothetical protein KFL_007280050 [Klebsormidium nitens]